MKGRTKRVGNASGATIAVTALLALLISGCATYVPARSESYATAFQNPPLRCPEAGSKPCASFYVSEEDLKKTAAAHFGLAGIVLPVVVPAGQLLTTKTIQRLSDFFDLVSFNRDVANAITVRLALVDFSVSAFTGKASLEISVTVTDPTGRQLLAKDYSAKGEGHFPLYANEYQQQRQIEHTTEQAFEKVFDLLAADLKETAFNVVSEKAN